MEFPKNYRKGKPLDPIRVLKATLPNRAAQEAYHRALEEALPIRISRFCGKWQFTVKK